MPQNFEAILITRPRVSSMMVNASFIAKFPQVCFLLVLGAALPSSNCRNVTFKVTTVENKRFPNHYDYFCKSNLFFGTRPATLDYSRKYQRNLSSGQVRFTLYALCDTWSFLL